MVFGRVLTMSEKRATRGPQISFLKREVTECRPAQPGKYDREKLREMMESDKKENSK